MPFLHHKLRLGRAVLLLVCLLAGAAIPARAADRAVTWPALRLSRIADGLDRPVHLAHAGDGSGRLFIVERTGRIVIWRDGSLLPTPFLDIRARVNARCGECGLLSVAFPPDYATTGVFYVYYNAQENLVPGEDDEPDGANDSVIARFRVTADPNVADPASEEHILLQNQPAGNHNGGLIAFGPDDYLYIGLGDGGGRDDTYQNGQNRKSLLGKMLRIQVAATGIQTYTVPADNPFVGNADYRPEIWATGLRNPWRFAFDPVTDDLYIGDVGQNAWEEINVQPASSPGGENYGWPIMEGSDCFNAPSCNQTGLTLPVPESVYSHANDCSVTGGFVFRSKTPGQAPVYLYGDYCSGTVRGLQRDGAGWAATTLFDSGQNITSFGVDGDGYLYLLGNGGNIYRLFEPLAGLHLPFIAAE